jgi:hypothetical protein
MNEKVRLACEERIRIIPLSRILPMRVLDKATLRTTKCRCISASIAELGLIEPLVVYPQPSNDGFFMLLDGHVRLTILRELGWESCKCLVATDDEAFTYNHKVNRLSAIQEHFMVMRAVKGGITEERIAKTLNVDVARIRQKRDLLQGICREAVEILKHKQANAGGLRELRRVQPMRQIEIAELMCASHNFSQNYAKCLVATTPADQLVAGEQSREFTGLTPDEISRMEHEMSLLGREFKVLEESHGKNVLNLVVVIGYLKQLLDSARVVRYLSQRHPEILSQFQKLAELRNLAE